MEFRGNASEYLNITYLNAEDAALIVQPKESCMLVLWFEGDSNVLEVDGTTYRPRHNSVLFLTEFHRVQVSNLEGVHYLCFNRAFYCVLEHDEEVGCRGLLFFGASGLPSIQITEAAYRQFSLLWDMFMLEMQTQDNLQVEMLQMMLKRYLILCARLYKEQAALPKEVQQTDLIRDFNFLVEQYYASKHTVAAYAALLHKSPKTLSNLFSKYSDKSPLQLIQDRKLLEARRLLRYTDYSIQEVSAKVGFEDVQSFSRFFKRKEGCAPSTYRG